MMRFFKIMHLGIEMNELCEMSTISSWVRSVSSSGKVDRRLWERSRPERVVWETALLDEQKQSFLC